MQDGRAEAAHQPQQHGGVRERAQVVDVLDEREAGAHREPLHGRVHEEADPPARNQEHEEGGLDAFPR